MLTSLVRRKGSLRKMKSKDFAGTGLNTTCIRGFTMTEWFIAVFHVQEPLSGRALATRRSSKHWISHGLYCMQLFFPHMHALCDLCWTISLVICPFRRFQNWSQSVGCKTRISGRAATHCTRMFVIWYIVVKMMCFVILFAWLYITHSVAMHI